MTATEIKIRDLEHATTRGTHVDVEKHARYEIWEVLTLENQISYMQIVVVQRKGKYGLCDGMNVGVGSESSEKNKKDAIL